jgi:hypothetical protein
MIWLILLSVIVLFLFGLDALILRRLDYLSIDLGNIFDRVRMLEHDAKIDRGDY